MNLVHRIEKYLFIAVCAAAIPFFTDASHAAHVERVTESEEYAQFAEDFSQNREFGLDDAGDEELLPQTYRLYRDFEGKSMFRLPASAGMQEIKAELETQWVTEHDAHLSEFFSLREEGTKAGHWDSVGYSTESLPYRPEQAEALLGENGEQASEILVVSGTKAMPSSFAVLGHADGRVSVVLLEDGILFDDSAPAAKGTEYSFWEMKRLLARYGSSRYLPAALRPLRIIGLLLLPIALLLLYAAVHRRKQHKT